MSVNEYGSFSDYEDSLSRNVEDIEDKRCAFCGDILPLDFSDMFLGKFVCAECQQCDDFQDWLQRNSKDNE